jgi:hypothetical protein
VLPLVDELVCGKREGRWKENLAKFERLGEAVVTKDVADDVVESGESCDGVLLRAANGFDVYEVNQRRRAARM